MAKRARAQGAAATYREAGVDIDAGNEVVRRIGRWVKSTYTPLVLPGRAGGFAGFMALGPGPGGRRWRDPVLVGCTDGVGTKLKVAFLTGRFDTVGIDLVAMSVNDLIVGGARPMFFLDYLATGRIEPRDLEQVVKGVAVGCRAADCALLGGETAEMPGFYQDGEFDLAGTAVGVVERSRIIDGQGVEVGDAVIGVASSGLHSNGYSLVRRVLLARDGRRAVARHVAELGRTLGEELLSPTAIYVRAIQQLITPARHPVRAIAHITGGGLVENVPRVLPRGVDVRLVRGSWEEPPIFALLKRQGRIEQSEMDRVFNLGLGLVLIVRPAAAQKVMAHLATHGHRAWTVGEVVKGRGRVRWQTSKERA